MTHLPQQFWEITLAEAITLLSISCIASSVDLNFLPAGRVLRRGIWGLVEILLRSWTFSAIEHLIRSKRLFQEVNYENSFKLSRKFIRTTMCDPLFISFSGESTFLSLLQNSTEFLSKVYKLSPDIPLCDMVVNWLSWDTFVWSGLVTQHYIGTFSSLNKIFLNWWTTQGFNRTVLHVIQTKKHWRRGVMFSRLLISCCLSTKGARFNKPRVLIVEIP